MYPADKNNADGKLRLLYEGSPMSFIVEQAGGKSTTGTTRVLDIVPVSKKRLANERAGKGNSNFRLFRQLFINVVLFSLDAHVMLIAF